MKSVSTIVAVLALALSGTASAIEFVDGQTYSGPGAKAKSASLSAAQSGSLAANGGQGNGSNNITFNSEATDELKTVPDVSAPGLTTTMTETCMGSTSAGVAWLGFGVTGGTTWRDGRCANRLDARQWGNFGVQVNDARLIYVGVELLCEDEGNQRAAARAGVICGPQDDDSPVVEEQPIRPINEPVANTDSSLPPFFVDNES